MELFRTDAHGLQYSRNYQSIPGRPAVNELDWRLKIVEEAVNVGE